VHDLPLPLVRYRRICISRTPAFAVDVITPLVFAGVVGAAAPDADAARCHNHPGGRSRPTPRETHWAPRSSPSSNSLRASISRPPPVSAPPPTVVMNSPGALGIPTIALSAYRNAEQIVTASEPRLRDQLEPAGRYWSHRINARQRRRHRRPRHRDPPHLRAALDGTLPGNEVIVQRNVKRRGHPRPARWDRCNSCHDTWARYASDGKGGGVADPQNLYDSTLAAARYLCSGGLNLRDPTQVLAAILSYNNSMSYAQNVAGLGRGLRHGRNPDRPAADHRTPAPARRRTRRTTGGTRAWPADEHHGPAGRRPLGAHAADRLRSISR